MSAASDLRCWVLRSLFPPNTLARHRSIRLSKTLFKRSSIMSDRDFRLLQYHQKLDEELRSEIRRAWPSFDRIQRLKRMKLAVKDRLQRVVTKGRKRPELV